MSLENNKKIALSFLENFSAGNSQGVLDLFDEAGTWWFLGDPKQLSFAGTMTKSQVAEMLKGLKETMAGPVKITASGVIAEDDKVAIEAESQGETKTGKIYNNKYHFVFKLKNGKILYLREYCDTLHVKSVFG